MNQPGESLSAQEAPTSSGTSTGAEISYAELDLFTLGRRAGQVREHLTGGRGTFVRSRQLLATGIWRGPKDAAESYVDEADLAALGGWEAVRKEGVRTLVGGQSLALHQQVVAQGGRSVWRVFFAAERAAARENGQLFAALQEALLQGFRPFGLLPTPDGEALGLPSLRMFAEVRVAFPEVPHVFAEVALLGPRLAQMALGFGADALFAPIVSERALRVGDNAKNPAMTRKEAATLLRGAGLVPCERRSDGTLEEVES